MADKKDKKEQGEKQEIVGIDPDQIKDTREHIAGLIGLLCYSDYELKKSLKTDGINAKNLEKVKSKITEVFMILQKPTPDLSWMDEVTFSIVVNDDENYTIPLPHKE